MSIRLISSGHSLSTPTKGEARAEIFSRRSIVAPTRLLSDELAAYRALAALEIYPEQDESLLILQSEDGKQSVAMLLAERDMPPAEYVIHSPLLVPAAGSGLRVSCDMHGGLLALRMEDDNGVIFTDTFYAHGVADLLYWVTKLTACEPNRENTLYIKGEAKKESKLLKRYFKRVVICE